MWMIGVGVAALSYIWDSHKDAKNQEKREEILCKIDEHRMKEIQELKQEIERLKKHLN